MKKSGRAHPRRSSGLPGTLGLPGGISREVYTEQFEANRSSLPYRESFAPHRLRLTRLLLERAPASGRGRLCVLGAGNGNDIDLSSLLQAYAEVHLVDLDKRAILGARARLPEEERSRVALHAPVDLSGLLRRLPDWKARRLLPEEVMHWPGAAVDRITGAIGHSFDVVASTCLLSQMQLGLVQALGDRHPFFGVARRTVNVVHLRTLVRLLVDGGRAVLATDVASVIPPDMAEDDDPFPLLEELTAQGKLMDSIHPALLRATFADDPSCHREGSLSEPFAAWLWRNGPEQTFLVYAVELSRRAAGEPATLAPTRGAS